MISKKIILEVLFLILYSFQILSKNIPNFNLNLPINVFIKNYSLITDKNDIDYILKYLSINTYWKIYFIISKESLKNKLLNDFTIELKIFLNRNPEIIAKEYPLDILMSTETQYFPEHISKIIIEYILKNYKSDTTINKNIPLLLLKCDEAELNTSFNNDDIKQYMYTKLLDTLDNKTIEEIIEYQPLNKFFSTIIIDQIKKDNNEALEPKKYMKLLFLCDDTIWQTLDDEENKKIKLLLHSLLPELSKLSAAILLKKRDSMHKRPYFNNAIIEYLYTNFTSNHKKKLDDDYISLLLLCSTIKEYDDRPLQKDIDDKYKNMMKVHKSKIIADCCSLSSLETINMHNKSNIFYELLGDIKSENDQSSLKIVDKYLLFFLKIFYDLQLIGKDKNHIFYSLCSEEEFKNKKKFEQIACYSNAIVYTINYCCETWNNKNKEFQEEHISSILYEKKFSQNNNDKYDSIWHFIFIEKIL